ncbi:MAG: cell wall hydrolase [Myxococcales bacterium]|nr:cell wall hydrolase [Myxococcales bacterium]
MYSPTYSLLRLVLVLTLTSLYSASNGLIPSASASTDRDAYYLALAMYHEARGESDDGMLAVGWVVLNRVADTKYPNSITNVVTQRQRRGCEFGWWCDGRPDHPNNPKAWQRAEALALQLINKKSGSDPTHGALWFFESWRKRPQWMVKSGIQQTVNIGRHNFYGWPKE